MILKNCQICYQVESDTLNYFYKNSFSNKKNDVAVKFEVKEFFLDFKLFLRFFFGFFLLVSCGKDFVLKRFYDFHKKIVINNETFLIAYIFLVSSFFFLIAMISHRDFFWGFFLIFFFDFCKFGLYIFFFWFFWYFWRLIRFSFES